MTGDVDMSPVTFWAPLGGPRESMGRGQKAPQTQKVLSKCLGGGLGGPWGDFGHLGWSLGPTQGVQMLIFRWF